MGFPWILARRDWRLSKRVPKIVIFLRIAEARRWASGPVKEDLFLSEIIPFISSASFKASLYSLIHESDEDAIDRDTQTTFKKNYEQRESEIKRSAFWTVTTRSNCRKERSLSESWIETTAFCGWCYRMWEGVNNYFTEVKWMKTEKIYNWRTKYWNYSCLPFFSVSWIKLWTLRVTVACWGDSKASSSKGIDRNQ